MNRSYLVLLVLLLAAQTLCAQSEKKLTLSKDFWGYKYLEGGTPISKQQAMRLLESHPEAIKLFRQGNANLVPAGVVGFAGGFMIGWPLGESISGKKDPQWALAAGGLALVIVGGALEKTFQKKADQAFKMYNESTLTSSLKINASVTGVSITFTF